MTEQVIVSPDVGAVVCDPFMFWFLFFVFLSAEIDG